MQEQVCARKQAGQAEKMSTTAMVQTCTFFFLECVSGADHGSKRGAGLNVELDQKCS